MTPQPYEPPCGCPLAGWGSHTEECELGDGAVAQRLTSTPQETYTPSEEDYADSAAILALYKARMAHPDLRLGQLLVTAADRILIEKGVRLGPIPDPLWHMSEAQWTRAFTLLAEAGE